MIYTHLKACLFSLFACCLLAQDAPKNETWMPKGMPHHPEGNCFDAINVSIAKASPDGKMIQLAKPNFVAETRTKTISKTSFIVETRVRAVEKNGMTGTEQYSVQIPVTTTEEVAYEVRLPKGSTKLKLPLESVRAWDINGTAIAPAELLQRLEAPTHVWAIEVDQSTNFKALDPFYTALLRPDAMVIYYTSQKGPMAAPIAPRVPAAAPVPAAPSAPAAAPVPAKAIP